MVLPALAVGGLTAPTADAFWYSPENLPRLPAAAAFTHTDTLGLAQLTWLALRNNPRTREAWEAARSAAADLTTARSDYWPDLDAQFGLSRSQSLSSGGQVGNVLERYGPSATLSYVLFDSGARAGRTAAAAYRLLAANLNHQAVLRDVVSEVEQAYFTLAAARAAVDANRSDVEATAETLSAANERLRAGLATVGDVAQAKTAAAQARLRLRQAQREAEKFGGALATAAGLPVQTALELEPLPEAPPPVALPYTAEELLKAMRERRPDLIAAQAQVEAARGDVRAARAQGRPTLELAATTSRAYFLSDRPTSDSYNIGLNLRIPLFHGFAERAARAQAEAELGRAEAVRDGLVQDASLALWQARADYNAAGETSASAQTAAESATQALEIARARYEVGVGNILEVLTAQAAAAQARLQGVQARLDWHAATARLYYAVGLLDLSNVEGEL